MRQEISSDQFTAPGTLSAQVLQLLRFSGVSRFVPGKVYTLQSAEFMFTDHVFAFRPDEWYVAPRNGLVERGTTGTVLQVSHVIELGEYGQVQVSPKPNSLVVKAQPTGDDKSRESAVVNEANCQSLQDVNVRSVLFSGGYGYILMENCGFNLEKWLQQRNLTFDQRLAMVTGICISLLRSKQNKIIHGDIKPSNFCYTEKNGVVSVKLIDCGTAKLSVNGIARSLDLDGTSEYLAPEVAVRQADKTYEYSDATDVYAAAGTLAQALGIPIEALLLFKNEAKASATDTLLGACQAPFDLSALFVGMDIPSDVDPALLASTRQLLEEMQANQTGRPDMEYITKFFTTIPQRRAEYRGYQERRQQLDEAFQQLQSASVDNMLARDASASLGDYISKFTAPTLQSHRVENRDLGCKSCFAEPSESTNAMMTAMDERIAHAEQLVGMLPSKKLALFAALQAQIKRLEQKYVEIGANTTEPPMHTFTHDGSDSAHSPDTNPWIIDFLQTRAQLLHQFGVLVTTVTDNATGQIDSTALDPTVLQSLVDRAKEHSRLCDNIMSNYRELYRAITGDTFASVENNRIRKMRAALKASNQSPLARLLTLQTIASKPASHRHHCMLFHREATRQLHSFLRMIHQLPQTVTGISDALSDMRQFLLDEGADTQRQRKIM